MMIHQRQQLTPSVFAALLCVAAVTHAEDSRVPECVRMTERPLNTEQAQAAQKVWANHLEVEAIFENSIGMRLCVIPPGTFPMGLEGQPGGKEAVEVTHSQPFFVGQYEVTQGEWKRVMGPLRWQRKAGGGDRFPINGINYAEAADFCKKLTQLDRKASKLPEGYEYRLPTDAELEYAGRAGTLTRTYFGEKLTSMQANFDGSQPHKGAEKSPYLGKLTEVGSYPANAWGLHDTIGNVAEWCLDWYHPKVNGGVDPVQLLPAPEHAIPKRVERGGSYRAAGRYCRSANRYHNIPEQHGTGLGFRPVLTKLHLDGLQRLTDSTHTNFNQTWTRDGTNTRIWHQWNSKPRGHFALLGHIDRIPGEKYAERLTDKSQYTWAHTCLSDGRILVRSNPSGQELGYYLMTLNKDGMPTYERIQCDLTMKGVLDRISLSTSETKVCFEFQTGFESDAPGRTLYVADFDAKQPSITGAKPFANEDGKPVWYAFPRWSKDETGIVYQVDGKLFLYDLANKSTTKVSVNDPFLKLSLK